MEEIIKSYYTETKKVLDSLSQSNREYFEKVEDYMIFSGIFYDEISLRKVILQMALDLKDAEQDGLTVVEYFGDNPKKMIDNVIREAKVDTRISQISLFTIFIGAICYCHFLSDFSSDGLVTINVFEYLSSVVFGFVVMAVFLTFYKQSIYGLTLRKDKLVSYLTIVVIAALIIALVYLLDRLRMVFVGPIYTFSTLVSIVIASILVIGGLFLVTRRKLFRVFIPVIVGYFLAGILALVINTAGIQHNVLQFAPIIVICLSLLVFLIMSRLLIFK